MTTADTGNAVLALTTLVIDSATDACSVALFSGESLIAGDYRLLGRGHAEVLIPMIAALPNNGRADRIAVALGPGSFTGVRVGLAAARALAMAWKADIVGYPTLHLIAAMARDTQGSQPLAVVMTGGHGEWFIETFDGEGNINRPLASLRPDTACIEITDDLVVGNQAQTLVDSRQNGHALPLYPDARAFPLLPPTALTLDTQPIYGRAPDAKLPTKTV